MKVDLLETWGSDERIITTARASTKGGFVSWEPYDGHPKGDLGLLAYLWREKHGQPFEFCGATFEVEVPIFVARQWMRHRVPFAYNEESARYSVVSNKTYIPDVDDMLDRSDSGLKQGGPAKGARKLTRQSAEEFTKDLQKWADEGVELYCSAILNGTPKELARLAMSVCQYTKFHVTGNLRGWLAFLAQRLDPHAQAEIRVAAAMVAEHLKGRFPRTMEIANVK